jgi:hypothetical protein
LATGERFKVDGVILSEAERRRSEGESKDPYEPSLAKRIQGISARN